MIHSEPPQLIYNNNMSWGGSECITGLQLGFWIIFKFTGKFVLIQYISGGEKGQWYRYEYKTIFIKINRYLIIVTRMLWPLELIKIFNWIFKRQECVCS